MNDFKEAELIDKYRRAESRLVLLDYDGTLVGHTSKPTATRLTDHLSDILIKLLDTPQSEIYIITGRSHLEANKIFDNLPVKIIAEHGAVTKERGSWKYLVTGDSSWKEAIIPILNQITVECPDSFVEEKLFSLAWHYRNSELQSGFASSRKLIYALKEIVHSNNLKILDGNKVVEIITREVGKGKAVEKLLKKNNYDFILSIGDDVTDEEMFEYLLNIPRAYTIKVGSGVTFAKYKYKGIDDVIFLLKKLTL